MAYGNALRVAQKRQETLRERKVACAGQEGTKVTKGMEILAFAGFWSVYGLVRVRGDERSHLSAASKRGHTAREGRSTVKSLVTRNFIPVEHSPSDVRPKGDPNVGRPFVLNIVSRNSDYRA